MQTLGPLQCGPRGLQLLVKAKTLGWLWLTQVCLIRSLQKTLNESSWPTPVYTTYH